MGWWSSGPDRPGNNVSVPDGYDETQGLMSDVAWVSGPGTVIALLKKIAGAGGPSAAVTIADGADVAQGTTSDAAWVSGSGTVISLLKKIASAGGSAVSVADGADVAQGTTTDLSSASTVIGLLKNIKAALAGTLTVASHAVTNAGIFAVQADTELPAAAALADTEANPTVPRVGGMGMLWNGATWDRAPGTAAAGMKVQSAQLPAALVSGRLSVDASAVAVPITDNSGSLTVDAPVGTPVFVRLSDGSTAIATLPVSLASVPSHAVTNAGVFAVQAVDAGDVANDGVDSGNPVKVGGIARTAPVGVSASADRVQAMFDLYGKLIVRESLREDLANQQTTITSSTSETTIVTADGTYKLDLYCIIITNTSATATKVTIKDSTAGTTRFVFMVPAGETRGFSVAPSGGCKQNAANNNWTATCGTSVASVEITALTTRSL